jgi:hypothetical protein
MVEITDRERLEKWLNARPPEYATLIATRAALRVLPLTRLHRRRGLPVNDSVLPTFRAAIAAKLAAKCTAPTAASAGARISAATGALLAGHATEGFDYAVLAIGCAAAARADEAINLAGRVAQAAARNAAFADAMFWTAISLDAAIMESGSAHETLHSSPLWLPTDFSGRVAEATFDATPEWASDKWLEFEQRLLEANEGWEVWTDWYGALLEGRSLDPDLELKIALIPEEFWKQHPAVVNAEIARVITEHERSDTTQPSNVPVKQPAEPRQTSVPTVAFFSYTRNDDRLTRGVVSAIRSELEDAVSLYNGAPLQVFQDTEDIEGGDLWRERLEQALAEATIFVPLITPAFFKSVHCREELSRFLARSDAGRLVLPIHFIDTDYVATQASDELLAVMNGLQWLDWRQHNRRTKVHGTLREDVHDAAQLVLRRWRATRPTS